MTRPSEEILGEPGTDDQASADRTSSGSEAPALREAIARIIDPEHFDALDRAVPIFGPYDRYVVRLVQLTDDALEMADAILAITPKITVDYDSRWAARLKEAADLTEALEAGLNEARDLLLERSHGDPARSAGHNARLVIERLLRLTDGAKPHATRPDDANGPNKPNGETQL